MSTLRATLPLILALGVLGLAGATPAKAYDGKASIDLMLGYAQTTCCDQPGPGVMVGASGSYGLGDTWTLRGYGTYALHPSAVNVHIGVLGAEILYLIDILKWVPFFGLGIDGMGRFNSGNSRFEFATHGTIGVDYMASWNTAIGLDVRGYLLPFTESGFEFGYFTIAARFSFLFDT